MLYLSYFIHGNLQYAEFPESAVPEIVERSYLPTLAYFAEHPNLPAVFEFSGLSLEILAASWPQAIEWLHQMARNGQIELVGSTLANPILPLIPTDHARRHILGFQEIYRSLFGDLVSPAGIYLQEFAYDPALAPLLRQAGYRYTFLTPELLSAGLRNQLNSALRPLGARLPESVDTARTELVHPLSLQGARGTHLAAIPLHRDLIDLLFAYSSGRTTFDEVAELLASLDAAYCRQIPGFLCLGPSDAEFIGFYGHMGRREIAIEKLGELMERAAGLPFVRPGLPAQYLTDYPPQRIVYIPAGTSEPAFDLWTHDPDNLRLNALCAEAAQKLQIAEALSAGRHPEQLAQAWRAMLLSENSDGRGWKPHPQRRLFCYDKALQAIQIAEEIIAESS